MSLTVTVNGEDVTEKIVVNLSAKATWGPYYPYYMAHPKWKFGDVLQSLDHSSPMRVMWIINKQALSLRDGEVYTIENPARWELAPEPDD